jgi:hypothetical protein
MVDPFCQKLINFFFSNLRTNNKKKFIEKKTIKIKKIKRK